MSRMVIFAWLVVVVITATSTSPALGAGSYYSDSQTVTNPTTTKKTELHFYMHNTLTGDNPAVVLVAQPNVTVAQPRLFPFGGIYVFDDILTVGPDPTSEVIGNARGIYPATSRTDLTVLLTGDHGFTSGEFNGSTISFFSRDPPVPVKEAAVIGGTGKFRMARGYIINTVVSFNPANGDSVVEVNATIYHEEQTETSNVGVVSVGVISLLCNYFSITALCR